jgi:DnaJ homolog subfamily C member 11
LLIEPLQVDGPTILSAASFNLNAGINHQITSVGLRAGPHSKLWSLLDGALIGSNIDILPSPTLAVYMSKQVSPFPYGKPFIVSITSTMPSNPSQHMPVLSASVTRRFGIRKLGSLTYSSGLHMWPSFVQSMFSTFMDVSPHPNDLLLMARQPSSLQLKYTTMPDTMTAEEAEELDYSNPPTKKELWQWIVNASPQGGNLTLQYARTLFADKIEDPPRSEWNLDGYHPSLFPQSRRGVRIEAEVTVSSEGGITWSISALRRIGEVSSIGLGFSARDARGLVMAITWRRLGQTIRVPIAICPVNLVDAELSMWAVMVPWLTYVGIEFGYIRPRERRLRREAIVRKRKLLKSLISTRKKESAQQIEMMTEHVRRRQQREWDMGGLFLTKAEYGYKPQKGSGRAGELAEARFIDVTIPLAARVDKGQLFLSKNTSRVSLIFAFIYEMRRWCKNSNSVMYFAVPNYRLLRPSSSTTQGINDIVLLPRSIASRGGQRWRRRCDSAAGTCRPQWRRVYIKPCVLRCTVMD